MKKLLYSCAILSMILITGCDECGVTTPSSSVVAFDPNAPRELVYIAGLSNSGRQKVPNFREQTITDTAMRVGAQAGLQWRAEHIDCMLKEQKDRLDKVYNFRALLLKDHVLPPVLSEGRQTYNLPAADTVRAADIVYRIIKPPRFVTTAPSWREYLWLSFGKPDEPATPLLPKTVAEASLWNCVVKKGWDKGIDQANQIFIANLERLNRDYLGIVLYHRLYSQNMVSAPFVSKSDLGVTGDEHEMRINDHVLRIASRSKLNINAKQWRTAVFPIKKMAKLSRAQLSRLPRSKRDLPQGDMFDKHGMRIPDPAQKYIK